MLDKYMSILNTKGMLVSCKTCLPNRWKPKRARVVVGIAWVTEVLAWLQFLVVYLSSEIFAAILYLCASYFGYVFISTEWHSSECHLNTGFLRITFAGMQNQAFYALKCHSETDRRDNDRYKAYSEQYACKVLARTCHVTIPCRPLSKWNILWIMLKMQMHLSFVADHRCQLHP